MVDDLEQAIRMVKAKISKRQEWLKQVEEKIAPLEFERKDVQMELDAFSDYLRSLEEP